MIGWWSGREDERLMKAGRHGGRWLGKEEVVWAYNFCVQVFLQSLSSCCFMTFRYLWLGEGDWVSWWLGKREF